MHLHGYFPQGDGKETCPIFKGLNIITFVLLCYIHLHSGHRTHYSTHDQVLHHVLYVGDRDDFKVR